MSRIPVSLSPELRKAVAAYAEKMELSLSAAIAELVSLAILGPEVFALRATKAEKTLADIKLELLAHYREE